MAAWEKQGKDTHNYKVFLASFLHVFDHDSAEREGGEKLFNLWQGKRSAADFALKFNA